ncbi:MAG: PVC-type heme-binding CxxCH protein [Roseibacillus sp.]
MIDQPWKVLAALSLLLSVAPADGADAADDLRGLSLAEGLEATLFASGAQLFNPASIDVDERGRVWVVETVNYRKKTRAEGDRIVILEDRDHDGRADTQRVFYQDHDIDGGHGVCVLGNQVIVSAPDRILLLTDTDGDDKADSKKLLFRGKVTTGPHGQHDHAIHAVMFGPDGRLYFNFGNYNSELRRGDGTLVRDVFGQPVNDSRKPYMGGMVIRCELDGSKVEVLGYNFRNNWEVTVDSFGSMWQSDNDNGSSSCRVNFVMEHGNYGYRDEVTGLGYQSRRTNMSSDITRSMWHQNDPGVVPNLLITGSGAPTGILVYEGDLLPERFRGQMIHAEPGRNIVWSFPVKREGAGYGAKVINLAQGNQDKNYRPCDVSVAPDGSLLIADWYDPVDCCHRTLDDTGRILRVAPPGHVFAVPDFDFTTPEGAAEALRNPNLSVRYRAWTALHGMKQRALPVLQVMVRDSNPRFRARALWLLAAIAGNTQRALELARDDANDDIRALALRIARRHQVPVVPVVQALLRDPSASVRRECAVSLHRLGTPESADLWADLALQHDGVDRWYLEALGIGEQGNETACFATWLKKVGEGWNSSAGREIVWRSRAPAAATWLAKLLLAPDLPEEERPRLMRALDFHSGASKDAALTAILSAGSEAHPGTFLEAFQRIDPAVLKAHPELTKEVQNAILRAKGTVTFVDLVARFERRDLAGHLLDMVRDDPGNRPGIMAARQLLAFGERERILGALKMPDQSAAVLKALGQVGTKASVALIQAVVVDEMDPLAIRIIAVEALGRSSPGANALVKLVEEHALSEGLVAPAVRSLLLSPGPSTRAFAAQQQKLLAPTGGERWPLGRLLAARPDPARGKAAFRKAGCVACHVVDGEGINFGPELSAIGTKLDRANLFSAILEPNLTITLGFEGVAVELKDGSQFTGYVSGESETTLSLRMMGGLQKDVEVPLIKSREPMKHSLMPAGLDAAITSRELVDLVGWLALQKSAGLSNPSKP